MFLVRIIIFIVIVIVALPYLKKGSDVVMKRMPSEISDSINKITKQVKEINIK
jgi:hypothetical protein